MPTDRSTPSHRTHLALSLSPYGRVRGQRKSIIQQPTDANIALLASPSSHEPAATCDSQAVGEGGKYYSAGIADPAVSDQCHSPRPDNDSETISLGDESDSQDWLSAAAGYAALHQDPARDSTPAYHERKRSYSMSSQSDGSTTMDTGRGRSTPATPDSLVDADMADKASSRSSRAHSVASPEHGSRSESPEDPPPVTSAVITGSQRIAPDVDHAASEPSTPLQQPQSQSLGGALLLFVPSGSHMRLRVDMSSRSGGVTVDVSTVDSSGSPPESLDLRVASSDNTIAPPATTSDAVAQPATATPHSGMNDGASALSPAHESDSSEAVGYAEGHATSSPPPPQVQLQPQAQSGQPLAPQRSPRVLSWAKAIPPPAEDLVQSPPPALPEYSVRADASGDAPGQVIVPNSPPQHGPMDTDPCPGTKSFLSDYRRHAGSLPGQMVKDGSRSDTFGATWDSDLFKWIDPIAFEDSEDALNSMIDDTQLASVDHAREQLVEWMQKMVLIRDRIQKGIKEREILEREREQLADREAGLASEQMRNVEELMKLACSVPMGL
ncbi:hypothetical protein C8Q76DRAFT_830613 [Earliella scabrosa]|nr:hypothetical protein C8Q76DRAFT_830613 [Earliella scabrosa]